MRKCAHHGCIPLGRLMKNGDLLCQEHYEATEGLLEEAAPGALVTGVAQEWHRRSPSEGLLSSRRVPALSEETLRLSCAWC